MLQLVIPEKEWWDEKNEVFIRTKGAALQLEHSLVSVSKWESKWNKPFLKADDEKTREETIDYIRCMTINRNVDSYVYKCLSNENLLEVTKYIESPMTATTFPVRRKTGRSREIVTSELIYYWMIIYGIPFECQKWHLNRLLTLIEVCERKSAPAQKMSKGEILRRNRELNAARRAKLHTKG